MDVDAPLQAPEQPVADADDEEANWEMEKAEMKRIEFNQNRELTDMRERVEDVSRSNSRMLEELTRHAAEIKEHINRQRVLESTRNELTDKNVSSHEYSEN